MKQLATLSLALLFTLFFGCQQQQQQPPMDMAEMMKPPPRPAELDRLQPLVGQWETTMEMKDPSGKVTAAKGSSTSGWEADKRILLERFEGSMNNEKMSGLAIWSYNTKTGKYQMFWTDSHGNESHGTGTYDEATKTWRMQSTAHNHQKGTKFKEEGTMRFIDPNTMEWSSTAKLPGGATMEMKGTSKRKS
jgi:Protein of unknown function (DUF1579)